jgi:hypothetical protein
MLFITLCST